MLKHSPQAKSPGPVVRLKQWVKSNPALYSRAVTAVTSLKKLDRQARNRALGLLDLPVVRSIPGVAQYRLRAALALNKRNELYELADRTALANQADLILAHALSKGRQYGNAADFFKAAEAQQSLSVEDQLLLVEALRMSGRADEAMARVEVLARDRSGARNDAVRMSHAVLHLMKGKPDAAYAALTQSPARTAGLRWMRDYVGYGLGKPWASDQLMRPILSARADPVPASGTVNLALIDYKSPDLANMSCNIGDYVQTLAMMRHIARHMPADGDGSAPAWQFASEGIASTLRDLAGSWQPDERRRAATAVNIVVADRDCPWSTTGRAPGVPVYMPVFGWFAHAPFMSVPVFPYPEEIRPFFVSFHLNKPDDLRPDYIDYLKTYAPIGCRDRSTRDWLMNQGVDAFVSGCVTTTLGLSKAATSPRSGVFDIETPPALAPAGARKIVHMFPEVKERSFEDNLSGALDLLRLYSGAERIVTSRLHCYLPARALGTAAEFHPLNATDRRYDGLVYQDDAGFTAMRAGLIELLDKMLGVILSGASEQAVYARWRELTAPLVAAAKAERAACPRLFVAAPADSLPPPEAKPVDAIPVALAFDANIAAYVPAVVRSIEANRSRAVRYIMMVRGLPDHFVPPIEEAARGASSIDWFRMDHFLQGERLTLIPHTTISTMDRLYLPELLTGLDKVIYLDIDLIVQGDVAQLYDVDVSRAGVAGRSSINPFWRTQLNVIESISKRLPGDKAALLRRRASVSTDLAARCFNAGVLVASLDRMRRDNFTEQAAKLAVDFQMNDQDILNFYSAGRYTELGPEWNAFPYQERVDADALKIIHWAGGAKPWAGTRNVRLEERWRRWHV